MPFPDKNGARFKTIDRNQKSECSRLELERAGVHNEVEVFAVVRITEPHVAQRLVGRVGIREGETFFSYINADLLFFDGELDLEVGAPLQID